MDNLSTLGYKVSFIEFKKPCPICGEHLDIVTHVHAAKHGLTRDEFTARFAPERVTDTILLTPNNIEAQIKNAMNTMQDLRVSPQGVSRMCQVSIRIAKKILRQLDVEGILVRKGPYYAARDAATIEPITA